MGRVRLVVLLVATLVTGSVLTLIALRGFSLLLGGVLMLAVAVGALTLCGRLPGQSFFKDSSPTRAYDSLQYP